MLHPITKETVSNGSKLTSYNFQNFAILAVISVDGLTIYLFDEQDNQIQKVQSIQSKYFIDASIW